ncbi:hypothetical protein AXH35_00010 [Acidipropionibacterium acidipropionici]|uniref:GmrSD restriction endonucleases C-terminal domain-containing protein n=1 Tax=Acidipropionibacterium acidipropionici TaxID=1748 RepID=A0AAC8YBS9_9ACTN|nr:hypothetical protein AXH35_00010 [Acidipropionibacterium acidipropionici]
MGRWSVLTIAIVVAAGWMVGQNRDGQAAGGAPSPTSSARPGSAQRALDTLAVKGRAARTGYDRNRFGDAWTDVDHNGCDTRNDILGRDLTGTRAKAGTDGCVIVAGVLDDPYTGRRIGFRRGNHTSAAVQIDHAVSLSNAWQTGAQGLDETTRTRLANDPLNLLAVDGPTNQAKSDGDAATWLPPHKPSRCAYVARQIAVKHTYRLWVTPAEKTAMARILSGCPTQKLPTR